jgi:quinol monooxygenase YgiN
LEGQVRSERTKISRRELVAGAVVLVAAAGGPGASRGAETMYGLIGKMIAAPDKRDELIAILVEGVASMPGCLSYVVAKEAADEHVIWITEVWDSKASHAASLSLASVQTAIARGRPLIAGFGDSVVTEPVGGHGLPAAAR